MENKTLNYIKLILLTIILLIINSCNESTTETNSTELLNTLWVLEAFEVNGILDIPPDNQDYNIQFKEDYKFSGRNDCNTISGYYDLNSNNITLDNIISTEVYCGKESLDYIYIEALRRAESYKIDKNELTIYYKTNSELIFVSK